VVWGIIAALTPTASQINVYDVTHAIERVRLHADLPPGELRLLTYLVEEKLAGRGANLHQRAIAADVFARDISSFEPRSDSIVRTTAGNLRNSLQAYYSERGRGDPVTIELVRGSYEPVFRLRIPLSPAATGMLWRARAAVEARTVSGYRTAIASFDRILAEAPNLSIALALKAEALASQAIHGASPRPNLEQAKILADRATDQAEPAWQAWLARGIVKQALEWNWGEAGEAYQKAIEWSTGEAAMNVWYASFLVGMGRAAEAAVQLHRAVDHLGYPNPTCLGDYSMGLILAGEYKAAQTVVEGAIEAAPAYYQHHLHRAVLLEAMGDARAALRALDETPLTLLERPATWGLRAFFAGRAGSPAVARRRVSWLRGLARTGVYIPHSQIAVCWIGIGDREQAVRSLEQAAGEREPIAVWFWAHPVFRDLRGEPGFEKLIDRIGLMRG
jgi:tetratricopeptide (TPR) repeat protein